VEGTSEAEHEQEVADDNQQMINPVKEEGDYENPFAHSELEPAETHPFLTEDERESISKGVIPSSSSVTLEASGNNGNNM